MIPLALKHWRELLTLVGFGALIATPFFLIAFDDIIRSWQTRLDISRGKKIVIGIIGGIVLLLTSLIGVHILISGLSLDHDHLTDRPNPDQTISRAE